MFFSFNSVKTILISSLAAGFLLFSLVVVLAAAVSPDAIAIRVIPNPEHHSILRWYAEQGFSGSPQSLLVDGYEAIRDGRTVYVNAANVDLATNNFYTNIYLISYNQEAEGTTQDIFGQIVKQWKFNTNLDAPGQCSIANKLCSSESECADGYLCQENRCVLSASRACFSDTDCPPDLFCSSIKSRVTRDTKRLADLSDIRYDLENYFVDNQNAYPELLSGTYLSRQTLSVWPSWQETLAEALNLQSLPTDPINRIGYCGAGNYDPATCWDETDKRFAGSIPDDVPSGSYIYIYKTDIENDNIVSNLCGIMESSYGASLSEYSCFSTVAENPPPIFGGINLPPAFSGKPYIGYISASDIEGDYLEWSLDVSPGSPWQLWSAPPAMYDTEVLNQKAIKADLAGVAGNYGFKATIDDGKQNGQVTKSYTINVINKNLPIIQSPENQSVVIGKTLDFTVAASELDSQYPLTFNISGLPGGLSGTVVNEHNYHITGTAIGQTGDYNTVISGVDHYLGVGEPINFIITVENNPPQITSSPVVDAIACRDYEYTLAATDPDGHNVNFSVTGLPANLNFNSSSQAIGGQAQTPGTYPITVIARDQYYDQTSSPYSAEDEQTYNLNVVDEVFTLDPINDAAIYTCPAGPCPAGVYHGPVTFFASAGVSTDNPVTYGLVDDVNWLAINPHTGEIQGTPTDNVNDPGTHDITVIATNYCGASYSTDFILTVNPNEWCGDGAVQSTYGEQCESGGGGTGATDQYSCTVCQWSGGWCGDSTVQTAHEQCEAAGNGSSATNQYGCSSCHWSGGWCGDGTVQSAYGEICESGGGGTGSTDQYACSSCHWSGGWCGDGAVQSTYGEQCESGGGGTGAGDQYACSGCDWSGGWCGDGVVQSMYGEECETGDPSCSGCQIVAFCGDGIVNGAEDCDDGNSSNLDSCLNDCTEGILYEYRHVVYVGNVCSEPEIPNYHRHVEGAVFNCPGDPGGSRSNIWYIPNGDGLVASDGSPDNYAGNYNNPTSSTDGWYLYDGSLDTFPFGGTYKIEASNPYATYLCGGADSCELSEEVSGYAMVFQ